MRAVELKLGGTLKIIASEIEQPGAGCYVTLRYDGFTIKARGDEMSYTLPADKQVGVQVAYVDSSGNPAIVDGSVAWDSSNDTIVTVEVDAADSTKAIVRATGKVGNTQVSAIADADLGEGVRELVTTMDVAIVAGEAVAGTITPAGPAEPIS